MLRQVEALIQAVGPFSPVLIIAAGISVVLIAVSLFKWLLWLLISFLMAILQVSYGAYQGICILIDVITLSFIKCVVWVNHLFSSISFTSYSVSEKYRRQLWKAKTYREWSSKAVEHDRQAGHLDWCSNDEGLPAAEKLRACINELKTARENSDFRSLLHHLPSYIKRNHLGIDNISAFSGCYTQTKTVISEYIDEIKNCFVYLRQLGHDILPIGEKIGFFGRISRNLGQTALCLSGGGSLSMYHMGVIRALIESGNYKKVWLFC